MMKTIQKKLKGNGSLSEMIKSGYLADIIAKVLLVASFASLTVDLTELEGYTDGVAKLDMICSISSLPISNFDSSDIEGNPISLLKQDRNIGYLHQRQ